MTPDSQRALERAEKEREQQREFKHRANRRVEALEEALRPFVDAYGAVGFEYAPDNLPLSAFEAARVALGGLGRERDGEEWTIRICRCGFPLGATLAAIRLKTCPDCGAATIPVEDVTRSVVVFAPGSGQAEEET
jgi:hypothetical protein